MNGQPLKVVQELLGHRDITTTMIYAHLSPTVHEDAVATLLPKMRRDSGHKMDTLTKVSQAGNEKGS